MEALDYWRQYHVEYPMLAKVVRKLYCIMATSVPSESLFSQAGYEIWDRRNALGAEKAEQTVIIQQAHRHANNLRSQ
jgi:hypothetical protein